MATYKSIALRDQLAQDLLARLPVQAALGLTKAFDSSGNPYLILGANTTSTMSAQVKIVPATGFGTDILGTAAAVKTPHILQLTLETAGTAHISYLTGDIMLKLMGECLKMGIRVDLYFTANTVMFTGAQAQTLEDSFSNNLQYGLMTSI